MTDEAPQKPALETWQASRSDSACLAVLAAAVASVVSVMLLFVANGIETMNCGVPPSLTAWGTTSGIYAGLAVVAAALWLKVASLTRAAFGRPTFRPWVWLLGAVLAVAFVGAHVGLATNASPTQEQCNRADFMS